ncbi:transmembrane protein 120 homolog [Cylas formicarius]|uniref:transmembrane protein 120 homolog n=1 Tax=Cylas formicarius TaxID=197179 RepID=UPI002958B860|nr:transmembrane protein 120 homolog [Cylas formicarius]XP_060529825.1 transmembrane protein 120 homolog [Cylas formicarius]
MVDTFDEEWLELEQDFKKLETTNTIYLQKLRELQAYQQECLKSINHQRYRMNIMRGSLKKVSNKERAKSVEDRFAGREAHLIHLEETLPKKSGMYLRLILGDVNVSFLSKEAKFSYKDDYEKFKLICHVVAFVLVVLNGICDSRALQSGYLFFLVWYYCTISIRESILKTNGSRMKTWWTVHHILSTVLSGILLVWPENEVWELFRAQFFSYNLYNCLLHYLQFKYQRGTLYRLKALGMRDNMDITIEGFHSWMWRGLTFLLPFLFLAYSFQLYNSYVLFQLSLNPHTTWHTMASSLLFLVLFLGNAFTTVTVVHDKIKNKSYVKYWVMARKLYNVVSENINKFDLKKPLHGYEKFKK